MVDELEQPRVLVAVHGHQLEQQGMQLGTDPLLAASEIPQMTCSAALFRDERARNLHEIAGDRRLWKMCFGERDG